MSYCDIKTYQLETKGILLGATLFLILTIYNNFWKKYKV